MTKAEQTRLAAWRFKVLAQAAASPRIVAQTCRHFGISRQAFYKWKTALCSARRCRLVRPAADGRMRSPRVHASRRSSARFSTSASTITSGPGRIADYLKRFHQSDDRVVIGASHPRHGTGCSDCRRIRSIGPMANDGSAMRSLSRATACSWT